MQFYMWGWGVILQLIQSIYWLILRLSLQGIFVHSLPFMYFFISEWTHIYLFYTLCYDLVLPYLLLAIGSSLSCVFLTYPHHCVGLFFFSEPSFPALHGSPGSSCIFLFSPRSNYSSSCSWRTALKPNLGSIVCLFTVVLFFFFFFLAVIAAFIVSNR